MFRSILKTAGIAAVIVMAAGCGPSLKKQDKAAETANTQTANTAVDDSLYNVNRERDATEMVFVRGGTFTMGCTAEQSKECGKFENPAHKVTVSDFYIAKYEVTQKLWQEVTGYNPSFLKADNLPIDMVNWDNVQEFIKKLNEKTGKQYRLPTEAEWEYAARGGNKSGKYKYSGSNNITDVAWYKDNSASKTNPVGIKQPNELGIHDMSGNVWEWVSDWYENYKPIVQTNPTGPFMGAYKVARGGSWGNAAVSCRISFRSAEHQTKQNNSLGFRLAISPADSQRSDDSEP